MNSGDIRKGRRDLSYGLLEEQGTSRNVSLEARLGIVQVES